MNRQIEVNLEGGGTMHVSSRDVVYMKTSGGAYELGYLAGKRIAKTLITDTPTTIGDAAEGLSAITNDMFSLINLDYVIDIKDNTSSVEMTYQLPNGRVIDMGRVSHSLSTIHTNSEKSPGKTARDTTSALITANQTSLTALQTQVTANETALDSKARASEITTINDRLAAARIP